jgi:hypothetical protein
MYLGIQDLAQLPFDSNLPENVDSSPSVTQAYKHCLQITHHLIRYITRFMPL